ncbi:MAG: Dam-replacing family protein [Parcubacteria group bacterium GW2011_GWA2_31_28]|nr:MAG: Dam-replacing family protein [Parcubacteria group bacterium GW2011_GWA2_31_28]
MRLNFNTALATQYKSQSQVIRVMTEDWVKNEIFCPNCGNFVNDFKNNSPVADFYCENCREEYELKSKKDEMGKKIVDGAYGKMIERLNSTNNPSFFFLNYDLQNYKVQNFVVIPKHFFVPEIIEKRKPLSERARRAGWIGCNILLQDIPQSGKIFYIKNGKPEDKEYILRDWKKTLFLRESSGVDLRGWILDVMSCIDKLNKKEFTLDEVYGFENILYQKHPDNKHIKDKIRQQLQFLRNKRYLEFLDRGKYRLT